MRFFEECEIHSLSDLNTPDSPPFSQIEPSPRYLEHTGRTLDTITEASQVGTYM